MLPDSILPTPEDDIARILRDYDRRLSHLETLEADDIGARVFNSVTLFVPNVTFTTFTFDSERWDTDGIHSVAVNPGRLTARTAGKYVINGQIRYQGNATGLRELYIVNSVGSLIAITDKSNLSTDGQDFSVTTIYDLAVGDWITMATFQNSGVPLGAQVGAEFSLEFMMQKIG